MADCKIGERTVRQYVHQRKIALGMLARETCVPQSYAWGVEAQVDCYEAYADPSVHVEAKKSGVYDFNADYRDFAYFNFLPSYADPLPEWSKN